MGERAPSRRSVPTLAIKADAWGRAYRFSLGNAAVFVVLSWLLYLAEPKSLAAILSAPAVFFVGAAISFILLIRSGGTFAAIAWFVLGAGVYFGLGVLVGGIAPDPRSIHYGSDAVLFADLLRIDALNASSVAIVLVSAMLSAYRPRAAATASPTAAQDIGTLLLGLFPTLVAVALASLALQLVFFPVATNLVVRTFLSSASLIVPFCVLAVGMLWSRLHFNWAAAGVVVFLAALMLSVLSLSKFAVMSNLVALVVGGWVYHRGLRSVGAGLLVLLVGYVVISPLVNEGRAHADYDAAENSPLDRLAIVADAVTGGSSITVADASGGPTSDVKVPLPLIRFSVAEIQGYLMQQYDTQQPGNSLHDFWAAAVPRLFWPDKPIITRFGTELHEQYWATTNAQSALAPTYSAEAYWNYGPIGVGIVSLLIGLELGWLTRRWHVAAAGKDLAFFVIAFPTALWASFVESWIAASYVGGFVTLVLLWHIARFLLLKLFVGARTRPAVQLRTLAQ